MESRSLWRSLRRNWIVEVVVVLIVLGIAAAAAFVPSPKYRATTTVVVSPSAVGGAVPTGATDVVTFSMPALRALVTTSTYQAQARSALGIAGGTTWSTSTTVEPDSGVLHISVESTSRGVVAPVANDYAGRLARGIPGQPALSVAVLDRATRPSSSFSPDRPVLLVLGAGLGVVLALLLAALLGPGAAPRRDPDADGDRGSRSGATSL